MTYPKHLFVGGLVAMGFDPSGQFLLTVTHSGRGVFATETWERVARDPTLAYPDAGKAVGIGPIDGQVIDVQERDERRDQIVMQSPDGRFRLLGESEGITISHPAAGKAGIAPRLSIGHHCPGLPEPER